jgi:hypothetical protein
MTTFATKLLKRETVAERTIAFHFQKPHLAGPPAMVSVLRDTLVTAGIDEDAVRAEEFAGQ